MGVVLTALGAFVTSLRDYFTRSKARRASIEFRALLLSANVDDGRGIDKETSVLEERLLWPALEMELIRSRRYSHSFALVKVGVGWLQQRVDYRDARDLRTGMRATADLLLSTRAHIDSVHRWGETGFAIILPESGEAEVRGLVRRLRRLSRMAESTEGWADSPLPISFGATFFPTCATSVESLLQRAEIARRLADKTSGRVWIDGAEAPEPASPATLRSVSSRDREPDGGANKGDHLTLLDSTGSEDSEIDLPDSVDSIEAAGDNEGEPGKIRQKTALLDCEEAQAEFASASIAADLRRTSTDAEVQDCDEAVSEAKAAAAPSKETEALAHIGQTLELIKKLRTEKPGRPALHDS